MKVLKALLEKFEAAILGIKKVGSFVIGIFDNFLFDLN